MNKPYISCFAGKQRLRKIVRQFIKYLSVGGISNLLAFVVYLGIVLLGFGPIASMTVVYVVAGSFSFVANKAWTFQSNASTGSAIAKYIFALVVGYMTNLALLSGLHYGLGLPHQIAQLVGIGVVAIELFLLSRYFVFA